VEEGIVPGGGITLIHAASAIEKLKLKDDEAIGAQIVKRALEEPTRCIAYNAGLEGSVVVERIKNEAPGIGLNARDGQVREPGRGWHRGPGQGDAQRPAERGVHRGHGAHH
jgi:chaperonin GroEL